MRKYQQTCNDCGAYLYAGQKCECAKERYEITISYENGSSYTKYWRGSISDGLREYESYRQDSAVIGIAVMRV